MDAGSLSAPQLTALRAFSRFFESRLGAVERALIIAGDSDSEASALRRRFSNHELIGHLHQLLALVKRAADENDWEGYLRYRAGQVVSFVEAGVSFSAWLTLFAGLREVLRSELQNQPPEVGDGLNLFCDL